MYLGGCAALAACDTSICLAQNNNLKGGEKMNRKWSMFTRMAFCCIVYGTAQTLVMGNIVVASQSQPVIIEKVEYIPISDVSEITGDYISGEELMSSADTYDKNKTETDES